MDRTAGTAELGEKNAETGILDRTAGEGQLTERPWNDRHSRKDTTEQIEKTRQDSWGRITKTGHPCQDSQDRTARTGHL